MGSLLPDGRGAVFRGVPFARPPVGDLRWRAPQPVVSWAGVRAALVAGPPAAQAAFGWNDSSAAASREDCLYLDVWAPAWPARNRQPVMVWLHGGGNVAGAGGFDPLYDGRALIGHGVVLVVVEYRLGVLGFFAHPELTRESAHQASGNYGIMDQIAALEWVRDNIASFGGDPGNVTVFGQSAGATDVLALMASPLCRNLFHRAIVASGMLPAASATPALARAEQAGTALAERLHAPSANVLRYLRSLPVAEVLQAGRGISGFAVDGWVFPAPPAEVFANGRELAVPLIVGGMAVEFPAEGSPAELKTMVRRLFGNLAPKALVLYGLDGSGRAPAPDPLYGNAADQLGSDVFRGPAVEQGEWHSRAGNPTWEFEFDRAIPPRPRVAHSSDLPYVFGNLHAQGSQGGEFQEADRLLSGTIQSYWTNFARTGNPNGADLPAWPNYDARARKYLVFTTAAEVTVRQNQRGAFCDLFRELLNEPATK